MEYIKLKRAKRNKKFIVLIISNYDWLNLKHVNMNDIICRCGHKMVKIGQQVNTSFGKITKL